VAATFDLDIIDLEGRRGSSLPSTYRERRPGGTNDTNLNYRCWTAFSYNNIGKRLQRLLGPQRCRVQRRTLILLQKTKPSDVCPFRRAYHLKNIRDPCSSSNRSREAHHDNKRQISMKWRVRFESRPQNEVVIQSRRAGPKQEREEWPQCRPIVP
jgi:hypothetical protein